MRKAWVKNKQKMKVKYHFLGRPGDGIFVLYGGVKNFAIFFTFFASSTIIVT
jgi:hypothetical protein